MVTAVRSTPLETRQAGGGRLRRMFPQAAGWASCCWAHGSVRTTSTERHPVAINRQAVAVARADGLDAMLADARDPISRGRTENAGVGNLNAFTEHRDLNTLVCARCEGVAGNAHLSRRGPIQTPAARSPRLMAQAARGPAPPGLSPVGSATPPGPRRSRRAEQRTMPVPPPLRPAGLARSAFVARPTISHGA